MKKSVKIATAVIGGGVAAVGISSTIFYNISLRRPAKKLKESAKEYSKVSLAIKSKIAKQAGRRNAKKAGISLKDYEIAKQIKEEENQELEEKLDTYRNWFRDQKPEELTINSFDGLKLKGYFLPCDHAKRTVICVHGYHGEGIRDFAFVGKFYYEYNSNLLIIDQRGHGESEGSYIDLGIKARFDVKQWAELINAKTGGNVPIYLDGVSMGAATVLMAGGLELPDTVHGIIADCGYSSPWEEAKYACQEKFHLPAFPTVYLLELQCRLRAGYSLKEASPVDAMKKCKVPVLFVHGDADDFVPTNMSQINYDACTGEKMISIIPNATHAMSYIVDTERCNEELLNFFKKYDD